jgi:RNA polymerase sigma-70 factor (ECF subfamily)
LWNALARNESLCFDCRFAVRWIHGLQGRVHDPLLPFAHSAITQLVDAMTTSPVPLSAEDMEKFREYLAWLARLHVAPGLRDRVDLSGVVQQTLLEAFQDFRRAPRERSEEETAAWLRSILGHNLADGLRKLATGKRNVRRDISLSTALDESASRLGDWLATQESSPSQKVIRQEQILRIAAALTCLAENQRRAIELHHLQGWALADIAHELQTSKAAVAGLLHRGLKALRTELEEP